VYGNAVGIELDATDEPTVRNCAIQDNGVGVESALPPTAILMD
jgi:hypothetical protein